MKNTWDKQGEMTMKNENTMKQLKRMMVDPNLKADDHNALAEGVRALELIGHLIDRPCEACEYHGGRGCRNWECVFEGR